MVSIRFFSFLAAPLLTASLASAFTVSGSVRADVYDDPVECGFPEERPLANADVKFFEGGASPGAYLDTATTGPDGTFEIEIEGAERPLHFRTELKGPFADVVYVDASGPPDGSCIASHALWSCGTMLSQSSGPLNIIWRDSEAAPAERASFYWVNRAHDFIKSVDPGLVGIDRVALIQIGGLGSNSQTSSFSVFLGAHQLNPNKLSGEMLGVITHEYGHLASWVAGGDSEGNAETVAVLTTRQPQVVRSGYPGRCRDWVLRDRDTVLDVRYDIDDKHIAGFVWALVRELEPSVGLAEATRIAGQRWIKALALAPSSDEEHVQGIFQEDANPANGPPHADALCFAARKRGFVDVADEYECAQLLPSFPSQGVVLRSWRDKRWLTTAGTASPTDLAVYAPSDSTNEFALVGTPAGISVVDLSNAAAPVLLQEIPVAGGVGRIAIYGDFAYSVTNAANGAGLTILDLSGLAMSPPSLPLSPLTVGASVGFTRARAIAIDVEAGYAYLAGANSTTNLGIQVLALEPEPATPNFVAEWDLAATTNVTVGQTAEDRELAFVFSDAPNVRILDVTNKADIQEIFVGVPFPSASKVSHGWFDETTMRLFVGDASDHESPTGGFNAREPLPSTTYVLDVATPQTPSYIGSFQTNQIMRDSRWAGRGRRLFEANYRGGLRIFDIKSENANEMAEVGFFASWPSHPASNRGDSHPSDQNVHSSGAVAVGIGLPSGLVIVADTLRGLFVLDPQEAVFSVDSADPPDGTDGTSIVIHGDGFRVGQAVTIGGIPMPDAVVVSSTEITGAVPAGAAGILEVEVSDAVLGPRTLVGGFTAFPHDKVELLGRVRPQEVGAVRGSDLSAYVSPTTGREYAFFTHDAGVSVIALPELGDPNGELTVVRTIPRPNASSGPPCNKDGEAAHRDVRVLRSAKRAYIIGEDFGGLQIINLEGIDDGPSWDPGVQEKCMGWPGVHNITINEDSGFLYVAFGDNRFGFAAVSLANPDLPVEKQSWGDGNGGSPVVTTHEIVALTYPTGTPYPGQEILFAFEPARWGATPTRGIDIIRASDDGQGGKAFELLSTATYERQTLVHHGDLSSDLRYLMVEDEGDDITWGSGGPQFKGTQMPVIDVSDLANPREVGLLETGQFAFDHHLDVVGDYVYEANYQDGLWIFDISDLPRGQVVGFFDSYPDGGALHGDIYNGLWAPYAELPSGRVAASDMERGFFLLDPTEAVFSIRNLEPATEQPGSGFVLEGAGFRPGAKVFFGGVEVTDVVWQDSRHLTGTIPPSVTGAVDVEVRNPDNSSKVAENAFGPESRCDLNFDSTVDVRDALLAARAVKGDLELGFAQADNADVAPGTPDGRVDPADLLLIERASRGEPVPACGAP